MNPSYSNPTDWDAWFTPATAAAPACIGPLKEVPGPTIGSLSGSKFDPGGQSAAICTGMVKGHVPSAWSHWSTGGGVPLLSSTAVPNAVFPHHSRNPNASVELDHSM